MNIGLKVGRIELNEFIELRLGFFEQPVSEKHHRQSQVDFGR